MAKFKGKTVEEWAEMAELLETENRRLIQLLDNPHNAVTALLIQQALLESPLAPRLDMIRQLSLTRVEMEHGRYDTEIRMEFSAKL